MMSKLQAAWVIGRRDFTATVMSRTFAFFLIFPVVIIAFSVGFGVMTAKMDRQENHNRIAVIAAPAEFQAIAAAHDRLEPAFGEFRLAELVRVDPDHDQAGQAKALLGASNKKFVGVLSGGLVRPSLTGAFARDGLAVRQVKAVLEEVQRQRALATAAVKLPPVSLSLVKVEESAGSLAQARMATAQAGQWLLFMVTVMLSGMLLSNMIEEKSNKVIEVLAAAIPVDSIFLGKLFAMLSVSLTGLAVWVSAGAIAAHFLASGGMSLPTPAVGWPLFLLFGFVYFAMNYLLLGALFLGIGSQASSVREVQTISMPVTIGQVVIFFCATLASRFIDSPFGIAAAIFPFSSPMMMIARAAETGELWPHLLALLWQSLWVWMIVRFGAAFFRSNVMKSGGGPAAAFGFRRRRA
ncbi:MAG: type transport system permease protein [Sphingomonadales bacterium]|jgi:ABC-2 type transport system permease protein|nr:type transport system permease protein [Sphingomonadales bacterium]